MRESGVINHHTQWMPTHYVLWTSVTARYGSRQLGAEWLAVVDDLGTLIPVQKITQKEARRLPTAEMRYEITSKTPQSLDI